MEQRRPAGAEGAVQRTEQEQGLHVSEKGKTFEGAEREETVAWNKETYQL